ncbi:uncharacterized protein LOC115973071 [Quercus lobata]|uniref:uncharacterized protein LOC115973071 n=1 Tax=Quercus lobata TaxID=97700 RepID=UPI0012460981|nr:uncharacterized protein LOC115973071 [Quercus lobata]
MAPIQAGSIDGTVFRSTASSHRVPLHQFQPWFRLFLVELHLATTLLPAAVHIDGVYTIGGRWLIGMIKGMLFLMSKKKKECYSLFDHQEREMASAGGISAILFGRIQDDRSPE